MTDIKLDLLRAGKIFIRSQLFETPPYPTEDFTGKTIIVTGANTGLGLEAARHFTRLNCAKLILGVRTVSKGQAAKESILESTKRPSDCIEVWDLDLNSTASVKAFAARAQSLERVDVLLENAGISTNEWALKEGYEQTIQVNVISTFLLALLMLPKLRETAEKFGSLPHLTIVSSETHRFTKFQEAGAPDVYTKLNEQKSFNGTDRYLISKLIEVLFVRELVKHTRSPAANGPVIDLVNPGLCYSELLRDNKGVVEKAMIWFFMRMLARTTEVGSRCLLAGAYAGIQSHGEFMSDGKNQEVESWILTPHGATVQKKVYEQTLTVLEKIQPGISQNI